MGGSAWCTTPSGRGTPKSPSSASTSSSHKVRTTHFALNVVLHYVVLHYVLRTSHYVLLALRCTHYVITAPSSPLFPSPFPILPPFPPKSLPSSAFLRLPRPFLVQTLTRRKSLKTKRRFSLDSATPTSSYFKGSPSSMTMPGRKSWGRWVLHRGFFKS